MQGKTIKGQILDETGESMIGVSVLVKGTTIGTVTDFDGNYTLEVPSGKNILEISYIGYKTKEITIGNNSLINIKMEPDTQALDEVVVIGYGTVKKRDRTDSRSIPLSTFAYEKAAGIHNAADNPNTTGVRLIP